MQQRIPLLDEKEKPHIEMENSVSSLGADVDRWTQSIEVKIKKFKWHGMLASPWRKKNKQHKNPHSKKIRWLIFFLLKNPC